MINEVVISSGHAKFVRGAHGFIDEVDEARKVVDRVAKYLNDLGVNVTTYHDNTSKTQADNVNGIVAYHNSKQRNLDVSVHFNAASKTNDPRGTEVLYYSNGNKDLATKLSKEISEASGLINRGAKQRDNLGFLKRTNKPAILIETCFVDSVEDVKLYQSKFDEICKVIAETVSGKKLPQPKPIVKETSKSDSIKIQTGGLNQSNRKELEAFLKERGWYYKIIK